jgi:hypothetical protein
LNAYKHMEQREHERYKKHRCEIGLDK